MVQKLNFCIWAGWFFPPRTLMGRLRFFSGGEFGKNVILNVLICELCQPSGYDVIFEINYSTSGRIFSGQWNWLSL